MNEKRILKRIILQHQNKWFEIRKGRTERISEIGIENTTHRRKMNCQG